MTDRNNLTNVFLQCHSSLRQISLAIFSCEINVYKIELLSLSLLEKVSRGSHVRLGMVK